MSKKLYKPELKFCRKTTSRQFRDVVLQEYIHFPTPHHLFPLHGFKKEIYIRITLGLFDKTIYSILKIYIYFVRYEQEYQGV